MENYMEANSTDSSETNLFDRWVRVNNWSLLLFLLDKNSDNFFTAATAIITFILFMIPSQPTSYGITSGILGKLYSNTMMVILNNRIVLQAQDESIMSDEHVSSSTSMSNPGISQRPVSNTSHKLRAAQQYFGDAQTVDNSP